MAERRRLFELEGLKFEIGKLKIDVSGEDPEGQLKLALTEEFNRVLAPVTQALHPQLEASARPEPVASVEPSVIERRSPRKTARRAVPSTGVTTAVALDWKPDIRKYGNPTATWSNYQKGSWFLRCYSKDHATADEGAKGLSLPVIVASFNKHFPQAKALEFKYLSRDFNRQSSGERPKVTADRSNVPEVWYLTDVGAAEVDERIKAAIAPVLTGVA